MNRLDKGLLFFYDWEECFDSLPPEEFKEMVMSMLRYKKYGTPPPEFKGTTKIAASLIFPQLDRQIKDFENGKKGGRPKKDNATNNIDNVDNKEESAACTNDWEELAQLASKKRAAIQAEKAERAKHLGKQN